MHTRAFPRLVATIAALATVAAVLVVGSASYARSSTLPNRLTVRAGDTLWGIATANGVTVQQLAAANGMSPNDLLLIGRHLVVPTSAVSTRSGVGAAGASSSGASSGSASGAPGAFCIDATFNRGPYGVLPSLLQAEPQRLALRPVMVEWADHYGVSPALVEAIAWQESGWQEGVTSAADAVGIGQLLPGTADFVNHDLLGTSLSITAASDNIRMTAAFLSYLVHQVGASPCMVAAAYYQGPAALERYGVFPETEQYVRDILALEPRFE